MSVRALDIAPSYDMLLALITLDAFSMVAGCIENSVELTIHDLGSVKGSAMLGLSIGISFGIFVLSANLIQQTDNTQPLTF